MLNITKFHQVFLCSISSKHEITVFVNQWHNSKVNFWLERLECLCSMFGFMFFDLAFTFYFLSTIITFVLFCTVSISCVKLASLLNNLILRSINFPVLTMTLLTESRLPRSLRTRGIAISSPILKIAMLWMTLGMLQLTSSWSCIPVLWATWHHSAGMYF